MTEEKVKKGEELLERLNKLKDQKSRWERGVCFFIVEISDSTRYNGAQHTYSVDDSFINLENKLLLQQFLRRCGLRNGMESYQYMVKFLQYLKT